MAGLSRAVASESIASCSSRSASVDRIFVSANVSTNAEEDQGQFQGVYYQVKDAAYGAWQQTWVLDLCVLPAKSTRAQVMSIVLWEVPEACGLLPVTTSALSFLYELFFSPFTCVLYYVHSDNNICIFMVSC